MTFGWINYFNSLVDWIELQNSVSHVHWLSSTIFSCSFVRLSPGAGGTPPASVTFLPLLQFYLFLPPLSCFYQITKPLPLFPRQDPPHISHQNFLRPGSEFRTVEHWMKYVNWSF